MAGGKWEEWFRKVIGKNDWDHRLEEILGRMTGRNTGKMSGKNDLEQRLEKMTRKIDQEEWNSLSALTSGMLMNFVQGSKVSHPRDVTKQGARSKLVILREPTEKIVWKYFRRA